MRAYALLLCCMALSSSTRGQTFYQIGTASVTNTSTSYPTTFGDYYENTRYQFLVRASELLAAGMTAGNISGISWTVTATNSSGVHETLRIKLGTTTDTVLGTTTWKTTGEVYGPVDYTPVLGSNTFTFTTPFSWNGTSNIVVEVCHGDTLNNLGVSTGVTTWTTNASIQLDTVSWTASRCYRANDAGNLCAYTSTSNSLSTAALRKRRPVTTFTMAYSCSIPATLTASSVTATSATLTWSSVYTASKG
jgi:trimeric autotransporter adhesin